MQGHIEYSTTLKFYPNLNDILPEFNVPKLNDYTDKVLLPPFILNDIVSRQSATGDTLPSPLVFKIGTTTTTTTNKTCYVGVREFSSIDDYIILPHTIQEKLGVSQATDEISITLTLETNIPKGSSLVLKPLDPDYDISNWKFFLEAKLNSDYTTLTKEDILYLQDNGKIYKLLIDGVQPSKTISIVNTDIDLSIEPLNDEHAKSIQEHKSKRNEIIELIDPINVLSLEVQSDNYKFKVPIKEGQKEVIVQLAIRDQEFDINTVDIFASNDNFIDKQSFMWSTLDSSCTVRLDGIVKLKIIIESASVEGFIYVIPFLWKTRTIFTIETVSNADQFLESVEPQQVGDNETNCANCGAIVSRASLFLHENFCLRNNIKCKKGCGKIFHKKIPESHWHCGKCSSFGDSEESFQHHVLILHTDYQCQCNTKYPNFPSFAHHKATDCELKLHECRFCHLIVPRGKSTSIDIFNQLSNHESGCGSKTVDCAKCNKPIKLINYESHMKLHELDRVSKREPQKCLNKNCIKTSNLNEFGLCDVCFGPSFSNVYDPTHVKLQSRFERRYVIQLSRGCGGSWCKNEDCKSSGLSKLSSMTDIINHVKSNLLTRIPNLPISQGVESLHPFYDFCVDASMTKKKLLAEWISEEGQFSFNWCCEAVNHHAEEQVAKRWLQENGVALHE